MLEGQPFKMTDVTMFEWDKMYAFGPYTPKEYVFENVGKKWTTVDSFNEYLISEHIGLGSDPLIHESNNQLVFIKGDDVILDVIFTRDQVDLTEIKSVITADDSAFQIKKPSVILHTPASK